MPAETPTFNTTLCEESQVLADKWTAAAAAGGGEGGLADPEEAKFAAWPSPQKVCDIFFLLFLFFCFVFCLIKPSGGLVTIYLV